MMAIPTDPAERAAYYRAAQAEQDLIEQDASSPGGEYVPDYPRSWDLSELPERFQRYPLTTLPTDFTPESWLESDRRCPAELDVPFANDGHGEVRFCTRRKGHSGRHAAGTGEVVIAVWP